MTAPLVPPPPPGAAPRSADPAAETREAVAAIEALQHETETVTAEAKRALGVDLGDEAGKVEKLRSIFKREGLGYYPLIAISILAIVDTFQSYAFSVLTPEIAATLGISRGGIAGLIALKTLMLGVGALVMARAVQQKPRRAAVALGSGIAWSILTFGTAFASTVWGLMFVLLADGFTTGSTQAVHGPLLLDHYPPRTRMRVLSFYRAGDNLGNVLAPGLVAGLTFFFDFTWRGVFLVMGMLSLLGVFAAMRLRDPGFGRYDEQVIRKTLAEHEGRTIVDEEEVALGFFEIVRRVYFIPTVRRTLFAFAALGVFVLPLATFFQFLLDERFGAGPTERGLVLVGSSVAAIMALRYFGPRTEAAFLRDPAKVIDQGAMRLLAAVVLICISSPLPNLILVAAGYACATALIATMLPALSLTLFSVVPTRMRPHVSALITIYLAGVGGLAGSLFLGGIDRRFGIVGAMFALMIPGVIGALIIRSTRKTLKADIEAMIADQILEEETKHLAATGVRLPMLACRGMDFSYGQLQVLFGIDFTVDDGEMVALLGTNGAGKSTLLRVISGTGLPQRGTVRFGGADITYVDAERRVRLGITQIPGGKATYGPLSVVENMRLFGFTLGRDKARLDAAIETCFATFPRLADRRNQTASTLSGGEQQMLGLSRALILQPRLLLIDELSLGLAPIIVGQLLDMVREVNRGGTAVVLVEQSVNVALSLVEHAYFMEKGEIRFDGPAADLLARDDLLRAVFLEGADAAATPNGELR